jgi:hypothetical protein
LNKEIRRRSNVVSIFPNRESVIRLIDVVLKEQHEEWISADKRYMILESISKIQPQDDHLPQDSGTPALLSRRAEGAACH